MSGKKSYQEQFTTRDVLTRFIEPTRLAPANCHSFYQLPKVRHTGEVCGNFLTRQKPFCIQVSRMPSEFVDHYTRVLSFSASRPVSPGPSARSEPRLNEATNTLTGSAKHPERKAKLHALLVSLNQNTTLQDVQQYTRSLQDISHPGHDVTEISGEVFTPLDPEEVEMEGAIIGKLAVALYSAGLEIYLTQATEAEAEAEWWADVEGSRASVALYLLQSMLLISAIFFPHC
jgi:hypothetical protein